MEAYGCAARGLFRFHLHSSATCQSQAYQKKSRPQGGCFEERTTALIHGQ